MLKLKKFLTKYQCIVKKTKFHVKDYGKSLGLKP